MTNWAGFTDDELRHMQGEPLTKKVPVRNADRQSQKKMVARSVSTQQSPIPSGALLSQPKTVPSKMQYKPSEGEIDASLVKKKTGPGESNTKAGSPRKEEPLPQKPSVPSPQIPSPSPSPSQKDDGLVLDEEEILSREIDNIEKFRANQKKIEEMNKKKKMALYDAIQQRQKQAKMEEKKLAAIHRELKVLDAQVTHDVSLVRDKIEEASREFLEAQKHYDRIEREFIAAKMDLHRKEELKESLTDHLYTIIHQNEVRKAKKLAELMHKLNMEESGEEEALVGETEHMQMPMVTMFNPVKTKSKEKKENDESAEKLTETEENKTEEKDAKEESPVTEEEQKAKEEQSNQSVEQTKPSTAIEKKPKEESKDAVFIEKSNANSKS